MIGQPGALLLVLAEAPGLFSWPTERRPVRLPGKTATDSDEYQANGPSDRRVRPISGPEHPCIAVDVELLPNGTINQEGRTNVSSGRLHSIEIEARLAHRLDGSDDNRQILRQTTCHDRVDRNARTPHGRPRRRPRTDHFRRNAPGSIEH